MEVEFRIRKWSLACVVCGHHMSAKTNKALDEAIADHGETAQHEPRDLRWIKSNSEAGSVGKSG
jgi:hypothetical protein